MSAQVGNRGRHRAQQAIHREHVATTQRVERASDFTGRIKYPLPSILVVADHQLREHPASVGQNVQPQRQRDRRVPLVIREQRDDERARLA